jgi:5'-nucleotidase
MTVRLFGVLLACCLFGGAAALAAPTGTFLVDVYTTTDLHGHAQPSPATLTMADGKRVEIERGGLARIAGYLKNARRKNPRRVLLVDGGDMLQGTLVSNLGEGRAMVRAMNLLGYDAVALGNHEFDFGPVGPHAVAQAGEDPRGNIKARAAESRFPWLSANIHDEKGQPPGAPTVRRYAIAALEGVKVGIVGGTSEDTPHTTIKPNLAGLTVEPLPEAIERAADEARRAGADVVVALVHAGGECPRTEQLTEAAPGDTAGCDLKGEAFSLARRLAADRKAGRFLGVDAIIGGHTHQPLTAVVDGIPITQAYKNGLMLGHLSLEIDAATRRPTGHFVIARPIDICSLAAEDGSCDPQRSHPTVLRPPAFEGPVTPDPAVDAAIAEDVAKAAEARARSVGIRLTTGLRGDYRIESPLGNVVADAIRAATHADLGITNGGGLRTSLPEGELRYGSLFEALPFDNHLATVTLSGKDLLRLLAANLASNRGILSVSGARISATCKDKALTLSAQLADGRMITDAGRYRVGTTDFLALGGDDFGALKTEATTVIDDAGPVLRDVVAAALERRGGELSARDPAVFDPGHPRIVLPGPRPIACP